LNKFTFLPILEHLFHDQMWITFWHYTGQIAIA
jgi:hypothetical protein